MQNGESLPNSHRHEVRPNGKIVIHYVEKNTDDGTYWCTAGNNRGVSARGRIDVHVVAGPVLDPFNFPENLREGRRTTLTCIVSAGDPQSPSDGKRMANPYNLLYWMSPWST
ncbi:dscam17 [Caerostris extrusa]|uniref:Dscam17 n=1 Tax=Caerostris extrusa TaxID=172846 RepID=A0AAV4Y3J6_CAEEX|nr:dscam17 [Caerostris extrusa]